MSPGAEPIHGSFPIEPHARFDRPLLPADDAVLPNGVSIRADPAIAATAGRNRPVRVRVLMAPPGSQGVHYVAFINMNVMLDYERNLARGNQVVSREQTVAGQRTWGPIAGRLLLVPRAGPPARHGRVHAGSAAPHPGHARRGPARRVRGRHGAPLKAAGACSAISPGGRPHGSAW